MNRPACLLILLTMAAGSILSCGCRSIWRRISKPATPPPSEPAPPAHLSHERALFILRGQSRGILLAANGGLISDTAPPNSLAAIGGAIELGLPMVMVEVSQTPDKVWVLGTGRPGSEATTTRRAPATSEPQRAVEAASSQPYGTPLADALSLVRGRVIVGLRPRSADVGSLVKTIETTSMADQVVVFVDTPAQMQAVRPYLQRNPPVTAGFDALTPTELAHIEANPPWPAFVMLGPETLNPTNVARVQAMGARVMVHLHGLLLVRVGSNLEPYYDLGVTVVLTGLPRHLIPEMRKLNERAGIGQP